MYAECTAYASYFPVSRPFSKLNVSPKPTILQVQEDFTGMSWSEKIKDPALPMCLYNVNGGEQFAAESHPVKRVTGLSNWANHSSPRKKYPDT